MIYFLSLLGLDHTELHTCLKRKYEKVVVVLLLGKTIATMLREEAVALL